VTEVRREAQGVLARLFAAYRDDPEKLPLEWRPQGDDTERLRTIGDFIAGMTDRYAIARHRELIGPVELPEAF
jgi:dGTPase